MDIFNVFPSSESGSTGWKRAAKVNCLVLACMSLTLVACLIAAIAQTGSLQKVLLFYDGDCDGGTVSRANVALHLVINVVSTAVVSHLFRLASSNFFMQVLNSPSREEVNIAHFKGSWMGIGIPSVRNAFKVSRFKTICWVLLLLSSIPMHLLFNSTLFETDRRDSDFHLTIATEEFVNGAPFYAPGGSLAQAGFPEYLARVSADRTVITHYIDPYSYDGLYDYDYIFDDRYGLAVRLSAYADKNSDAMKNISTTALNAGRWERVETAECKQEYINCNGLKGHRNLILVADKPTGWTRNDMWHLADNQTEFWDHYIPGDQPNHLFYDAQCAMTAKSSLDEPTLCKNNCAAALGASGRQNRTETAAYASIPGWEYSFFSDRGVYLMNGTHWRDDGRYFTAYVTTEDMTPNNMPLTSGLQPGASDVSVKYCLVERTDRICHVALSPVLLLAVTLCVIFKTCTAIVVTLVLGRRNQRPLVTLGDAIESFIEKPDPVTAGMCTLGQREIRRAMLLKKAFIPLLGAREWHTTRKRRWSVIPVSVWATSYLLFSFGIAVAGFFTGSILSSGSLFGSFMQSDQNAFLGEPYTFIQGTTLANSPQLLLSFCYLAYNNLFTRLQMAREWSLFGLGYQPLRVTDPKGDQYSTYRLQLPYKYSIPLIALSIFLHWLLSNTIYLFVSIGGYFGTDDFLSGSQVDPSLPPNTAVAVGYSGWSLVVLLAVICPLITVPMILGSRVLPSDMVVVGSNSLALSAACHPSILSHACQTQTKSLLSDSLASSEFDLPALPKRLERSRTIIAGEGYADEVNRISSVEMQSLTHTSSAVTRHSSRQSTSSRGLLFRRSEEDVSDAGEKEQSSPFTKLARSKIRWGVVKMPPEWLAEYSTGDEAVGHLSFGVEEDDVKPPELEAWYA